MAYRYTFISREPKYNIITKQPSVNNKKIYFKLFVRKENNVVITKDNRIY